MVVQIDFNALSIKDIEALQERVSKELTKKLLKQVNFKKFEFEPCDDRSMGKLVFEAHTKVGVLAYKAHLGNGYTDDVEVSLDDNEDEGLDMLEIPSFHDDTSDDEAKQACVKAIVEFEKAYAEMEAEEEEDS
jgi:hypothetical protein